MNAFVREGAELEVVKCGIDKPSNEFDMKQSCCVDRMSSESTTLTDILSSHATITIGSSDASLTSELSMEEEGQEELEADDISSNSNPRSIFLAYWERFEPGTVSIRTSKNPFPLRSLLDRSCSCNLRGKKDAHVRVEAVGVSRCESKRVRGTSHTNSQPTVENTRPRRSIFGERCPYLNLPINQDTRVTCSESNITAINNKSTTIHKSTSTSCIRFKKSNQSSLPPLSVSFNMNVSVIEYDSKQEQYAPEGWMDHFP